MRENYRAKFLEELHKYSLTPRKKGLPSNEGCCFELSDLMNLDMKNPQEFAREVKEGIHLMYQKQTSARVLDALQKYLIPANTKSP